MRKYASIISIITVIAAALVLGGCPKKPEETAQPAASQSMTGASESGASAKAGAGTTADAGTSGTASSSLSPASSEGLKPVYFDFDKSVIRHDAMPVMRSNAEWLKAHSKAHVTIEGNCDERGTIEYNQALGQRRAASAKKYLADLGVPAHRIRVISYGKEKPVCNEGTESCWQQNRRDDFVVAP